MCWLYFRFHVYEIAIGNGASTLHHISRVPHMGEVANHLRVLEVHVMNGSVR